MLSDHEPGHSFETEVLSTLSELSVGQKYIKETVDGFNGRLGSLDTSVHDLYEKHALVQLSVAKTETERVRSEADLATKIEAIASHKKAQSIVVARWYHWLILITGSTTAAVLASLFLKLLH